MAICAIVHLYFQHEWDEVSTPLASGPLGDDMVLIVAEQEAIVKASVLSIRAFSFEGPGAFNFGLYLIYDTLIGAGYYAYRNPLRSERLIQLKQEHLRQVKNAGAPDHAGIRSETRAETNRAYPTNQFRQRRGKVWEPQVVLEPDADQERMRQTVDYMIQHATFQRDQVILLLIRQTGARISEVIEMTAGGYRAARHAGRALVKNKGSRGREEKTIYFTPSLERHLLSYIRTERAQYDPRGRK